MGTHFPRRASERFSPKLDADVNDLFLKCFYWIRIYIGEGGKQNKSIYLPWYPESAEKY